MWLRSERLPAGDRTYLVLAKPNVIMNVEGDGLGALNRLHGDQCADNPPGPHNQVRLVHHSAGRNPALPTSSTGSISTTPLREPSAVIPVTAEVGEDGMAH